MGIKSIPRLLLLSLAPLGAAEAHAQESPVADKAQGQITDFETARTYALHEARATEFYILDKDNPFDYLSQGQKFKPSFHAYPGFDEASMSKRDWKRLCVSLAKAKDFSTGQRLSDAVNGLRQKKLPKSIKDQPRLMAFFLANQHWTQKELDSRKEVIDQIIHENNQLNIKYPSANVFGHMNRVLMPPQVEDDLSFDFDTEAAIAREHIFTKRQLSHYIRHDFSLNSLHKTLASLGFDKYNGLAPLTFMQMAHDYMLIKDDSAYKTLESHFVKKYGEQPKLNFVLNLQCEEEADKEACLALSKFHPEQAWESVMKYGMEPLALKDGSLTFSLGIRGNQVKLQRFLEEIDQFLVRNKAKLGSVEINFLAHGSYNKDTKEGAIHLDADSSKEESLLTGDDTRLFSKIGKVFKGAEQVKINSLSCLSGKDVAIDIAEQAFASLNKGTRLALSAPIDNGTTTSSVSQEAFVEYMDNGHSVMHLKNYFPENGTLELSFSK